MKKLLLSLSALLLATAAVTAADDPIAVRKALMQATGASAATAGGMLRGNMDYNPAVARSAIMTLRAVSLSVGDYFPEGSNEGDTTAAPRIWEDAEGFQQALDNFQTVTATAVEAAGREGPADLDAFRQAITPVLATCTACHENFRRQQ
jgi:cytochrome c556